MYVNLFDTFWWSPICPRLLGLVGLWILTSSRLASSSVSPVLAKLAMYYLNRERELWLVLQTKLCCVQHMNQEIRCLDCHVV